MLVIAVVTQNWKAARLGQETDFSEAYWYAYISTMTVGLGDYYLEHDVILRQDLFIFPVLFLAGFVLLANFFVKLTEVILNLVPHSHKTLEDTLAESKVPCMPDHVKKGIKAISAFDHSSKRRPPAARAENYDESDRTRDDVGSLRRSCPEGRLAGIENYTRTLKSSWHKCNRVIFSSIFIISWNLLKR
jgi:hypothetical protein